MFMVTMKTEQDRKFNRRMPGETLTYLGAIAKK